ncbi:aminodeoxychorismate/anthranilate synthase component II [Synechococcus sp. PCC 7336]|uniref:anthranilate synthase component II n=1 Tax=Synechococcus sp. PCC 7336 TaxID=195250 RepID=UPI0003459BF8|nr:aminodeoxychorismate/anthranilate synthase component II [Synechococcus sp. PCC 7336]
MLLVIDNYDSFTYNIVQYLGELGAEVQVRRNDEIDLAAIRAFEPAGIAISPGPGRPDDAGISLEVIRTMAAELPILGVCLGHQSIGQAFGGKVVRAPELMHGKTSPIYHNNCGLFSGLPNPFTATRYHSLMVDRDSCPQVLEVTAWTEDGIIMGLRHRDYPHLQGVQFHPESILTEVGKSLLQNFIETCHRSERGSIRVSLK